MLKFKKVNFINVSDWNQFVIETYGRPYDFQQQDDCRPRGTFSFTLPIRPCFYNDFENDTIPEIVNGDEMGVSFKSWLSRSPEQFLSNSENHSKGDIILFWERNFYPEIMAIVDDLYKKGLIKDGEYVINIDW